MYQPFTATTYGLDSDDLIERVSIHMGAAEDPSEVTMAIHPTKACVIHITKQQAMEFFGLVDKPQDPLHPRKLIQDRYAHHIASSVVLDWDILYLEDENGTVVKHAQFEGIDRLVAVQAFRAAQGNTKYIISVTEHISDDTNCTT